MIFIDTSFLFAFLDADNTIHSEAMEIFNQVAVSGEEIVSHNYIVLESLALFDRRLGRAAAMELLEMIKKFNVFWISKEEHAIIEKEFAKQKAKHLSFVDVTSFHFMRSYGIKYYLGFDSHFEKEGFHLYGRKMH